MVSREVAAHQCAALRRRPAVRPAGVNAHIPTSPTRPSAPTVLVLASGKGGTGVSLVSALLGLAVAEEGWRVLLVDGTDGFGALHHMLGVVPRRPLSDLRGGRTEVDELLTPVTDTLALLPGGGAEQGPPLTDGERQLVFHRVADAYGGYDLVVVDAGSRLDAVLAACTGGVTRLLVVATEDRLSLAASHALLAAAEERLPGLPVEVVVNRATARESIAVHDRLAASVERVLGRAVRLAGAIPDDRCLEGGLGAGMTVQDAAAGSPAAAAARAAGLQLLTDDRMPSPRDAAGALALTT